MANEERNDTLQELAAKFWNLPEDPQSKSKVPWPVTVMSRLKKIHGLLFQVVLAIWALVFIAGGVALFTVRW
jgi:hypothetical protein